MRSSVFLCHKGNILAIFKELLVENPLCCEDKFWPQRVMEELDAHVIDMTNAISYHGLISQARQNIRVRPLWALKRLAVFLNLAQRCVT